MPDEAKKTYRVKDGQTWGSNPELKAGETVELTEKEAAGFEDKLEPADSPKSGTEGQLPAGAVSATSETVSPPLVTPDSVIGSESGGKVVDDSGPDPKGSPSPGRTGVPKKPPAN